MISTDIPLGSVVAMNSEYLLTSDPSFGVPNNEGKAILYTDTGTVVREHPGAIILEGVGAGLALTESAYAIAHSGPGLIYERDIVTGNLLKVYSNPSLYSTNAGDFFGDHGMDMDDTMIVAGARGEDQIGFNGCGAIYAFDRSTGNVIHQIPNPNPSDNAYFGYNVILSSNHIVASAPYQQVSGSASKGQVYIFDRSTGALLHSLEGTNPSESRGLGMDVYGKYAVIGSDSWTSAWVVDITTGQKVFDIQTTGLPVSYRFGSSVAMHEDIVVVADHNQNGSVHVYRLLP